MDIQGLGCCSPRDRAARGDATLSQPAAAGSGDGFSGCFSSLGLVALLRAELCALLDYW